MQPPNPSTISASIAVSSGARRAFILKNVFGLHARPCALIVKTLQGLECDVTVACGDATVEAHSIFGLLSLAAGYDSKLTFTASGRDATRALDGIQHLFDTNFSEAY